VEEFQSSGVWPPATPRKTPDKSEGSAPSSSVKNPSVGKESASKGKGSVPTQPKPPSHEIVEIDEEGREVLDDAGSDRESNMEVDNGGAGDDQGDQDNDQGDYDNDDDHESSDDQDDQSDGRSDGQGEGDDEGEDRDDGRSEGQTSEEESEEEVEQEEEKRAPKRPVPPSKTPVTKKHKKSPLKQAKDLKKLKRQKHLLERELKLKKLKRQLKKTKRHTKYLSSDSSDSSSSSSLSSSEETPPKRPRKGPAPKTSPKPSPTPQPFDQAAMVKQLMDAMTQKMTSFTQSTAKEIEERFKKLQQSAGPPAEPLPQKEVPPLVPSKSVPSKSVRGSQPSKSVLGSQPSKAPVCTSVADEPKDKDEESDDESQEVRTSRESHKRRRDIFKEVLTEAGLFNFEVPVLSRDTPQAQAQFGHVHTPLTSDVLSVQEGMLNELQKHATHRMVKGFKKPDKILNRMYKVPLGQQKNWAQPPTINQDLVNVVNYGYRAYDKQNKTYSLNPKHTSGQEEKVCLETIARQQLVIRIINCSTMAMAAAHASVFRVGNEMKRLDDMCEDSNFDLREWFKAAVVSLDGAFDCIQEAQVNTVDLLKLSADSWLKAMEERRRLWLASARLTADQQTQLNSLPLNLPSTSLDDPDWTLLDKESEVLLKGWSELFQQDCNRSVSNIMMKFDKERTPSRKNVKGQGQGFNTKPKTKKPFPAAASGKESATGSAQSKPGGGAKPQTKPFKRNFNNKGKKNFKPKQ
jgi:hypothetical protein